MVYNAGRTLESRAVSADGWLMKNQSGAEGWNIPEAQIVIHMYLENFIQKENWLIDDINHIIPDNQDIRESTIATKSDFCELNKVTEIQAMIYEK